jgi:hypothetical protein
MMPASCLLVMHKIPLHVKSNVSKLGLEEDQYPTDGSSLMEQIVWGIITFASKKNAKLVHLASVENWLKL